MRNTGSEAETKKTILLVSPHPDDVMLSIGGALLGGQAEYEIYIWDVFTYKKYNKLLLDKEKTIEAVEREERNVLKALDKVLNTTLIYDNYPDAQLRGNRRAGEVLGAAVDESSCFMQELTLLEQLRQRFITIFEAVSPDCIGIPMGIGKHIDHLLLRETVLFGNTGSAVVFFYEDMPYSINQSWYEEAVSLLQIRYSMNKQYLKSSNGQLDKKLEILSMYESQLTKRDLRAIEKFYTERQNAEESFEKIWILVR